MAIAQFIEGENPIKIKIKGKDENKAVSNYKLEKNKVYVLYLPELNPKTVDRKIELQTDSNSKMLVTKVLKNETSLKVIFKPIKDGNIIMNNFTNKEINTVEIYELKNILTEGTIVKRLGIQGCEGLSFTLNGEDFQIGRSGYYSAKDVNVNFISLFKPDNEEAPDDGFGERPVIIDYEY